MRVDTAVSILSLARDRSWTFDWRWITSKTTEIFKGYRPCRRPQRPCVHWISIFKLSKCGAIWWWCHVIPGGDAMWYRVCTACQRHGNWTCSVCKTRRLLTHFSLWRKKHRGQHGKETCNICIHVKHARQHTHARLKRRRRKITEAKVAKVLQEVHTEIQQIKRKQRGGSEGSAKSQKTVEASPAENKKAHIQMHKPHAHIRAQDTEIPRVNEKQGSHGQDYRPPSAKKPSDKLLEYECPYCHVAIYSTVESGNVKATGHCGKQFRVRGGVVARSFAHACPKCGQQIQSSKESGRIQSTHKTPDGNTCTKASWVIK